MNTENNDIPRNVYRAIAARLVADPNYYTLLLDNPRQAFKDALTKVKIIADKETLDKLEARTLRLH